MWERSINLDLLPVSLFYRRGPASLRGSSAMNSRELAADVPLATQESDEDEFEVWLAVPTWQYPPSLVCWTTNWSGTCSSAKHCGFGRWASNSSRGILGHSWWCEKVTSLVGKKAQYDILVGGGSDSISGSLEDLVSNFDEKLTMCFQDYQEQVLKFLSCASGSNSLH